MLLHGIWNAYCLKMWSINVNNNSNDVINNIGNIHCSFLANRVSQLRSVSGRITIQSKSGQFKATVGYQVTVATSCLHYNRSSTQFLAGHHLHLPSCQPFSVSNEFALPVHVMEAVLSAQVRSDNLSTIYLAV